MSDDEKKFEIKSQSVKAPRVGWLRWSYVISGGIQSTATKLLRPAAEAGDNAEDESNEAEGE
jgi:hypothetical protein